MTRALGHIFQDGRYALRALRRDYLFTIPVVICMALVIGANGAVFSVVDALMLRIVPFESPDRLVALNSLHSEPGSEPKSLSVSPKDFDVWRAHAQGFEAIAGVYERNYNLADLSQSGLGDSEPERVEGAYVSPSYFSILNVQPMLGRAFTADEEEPGEEPIILLSHRLWQRRFGADPDVVGRQLLVDGTTTKIIGVMPAGFRYPGSSELWGPLEIDPAANTYSWHYLRPVARLAAGVSIDQARSEMTNIARYLEQEFPDTNSGWGVEVKSLKEQLIGDLQPRLLALSAGVAFLLLIACANLSNLILVRATARAKEMAIRTALGSGRARLAALLLVEGICLALVGGLLGLLLAYLGIPLISRAPVDIPAIQDVSLNVRVVGFTLLTTLVTGLLFSLAPTVRFSRPTLQPLLKEGNRGSTGGAAGFRLQGLFVIFQVAITLILLTAAGLLLRSFQILQNVDPGFETENLLTFRMSLPTSSYPGVAERSAFVDDCVRRLDGIPGVRSAAVTTALPVGDRDVDFSSAFSIENRIPQAQGTKYLATIRRVTPRYFEALGIPLREGRVFQETDHTSAPGVVIVSRAMADQYWPGESPIGKRLKRGDYDSENPWLSVVGVVADVKDDGLQSDLEPIWYRPYSQHEDRSSRYISVAVATKTDPSALISSVRREILEMDHLLPVYNVSTMREIISDSLAQSRLITLIFGILSFLGLILAVIGLYGVMSYVVGQRKHEIGIRMAMGAGAGTVLRLILRRGMGLAGTGLLLGAVTALILSRLLASLLYGVRATDIPTYAAVVFLLSLAALLANLIPAFRATKVNPITVLRSE